jgi:hypothetical protein
MQPSGKHPNLSLPTHHIYGSTYVINCQRTFVGATLVDLSNAVLCGQICCQIEGGSLLYTIRALDDSILRLFYLRGGQFGGCGKHLDCLSVARAVSLGGRAPRLRVGPQLIRPTPSASELSQLTRRLGLGQLSRAHHVGGAQSSGWSDVSPLNDESAQPN